MTLTYICKKRKKKTYLSNCGASLLAQTVKNLPAMWETQVQSLGWEDPLEEGMATHSSILFFNLKFIYLFNWRVIALQNCVGEGRMYGKSNMETYIQSVQFSRSVVSDSLPPHESQHARPPCPLQTLGVHSDSRPSSQ